MQVCVLICVYVSLCEHCSRMHVLYMSVQMVYVSTSMLVCLCFTLTCPLRMHSQRTLNIFRSLSLPTSTRGVMETRPVP